jgi:pantoate kinase
MWDALMVKYACDAFILSISKSEFYHLNNSHIARYHEKLHKKLEDITDNFLHNPTTERANNVLSKLATFNGFMDESIDQYAKYFAAPQRNYASAIMESNSASIRFYTSGPNISATNIKERVRKHGSAPTQR